MKGNRAAVRRNDKTYRLHKAAAVIPVAVRKQDGPDLPKRRPQTGAVTGNGVGLRAGVEKDEPDTRPRGR